MWLKKLSVMAGLVLILALAFGLVGQAAGQEPQGPPRKIVVFQASVTDEAAQDEVLKQAGAVKIKPLRLINGAAVRAAPASEQALRGHPAVLRVDEDVVVYALDKPEGSPGKGPKKTPTPTPGGEVLPWGVDRIDADLAWATTKGAGIKVAVLDTGIDLDHPDLAANIKPGINTINSRKSPDDDHGHGTHVAGTIAAVDNTIGVIGVAPQAELYAVKVLNSQGIGFLSDIIEGLEWSINHVPRMQVVNMSFGSSGSVQSFHDAVIKAYDAGIVLVAAAGNNGGSVIYPAAYAEVIAVSATDSSDAIASWSSRGPQVELAAPGVDIPSTWKDGGYYTASGTSMATPHVVGAAALVLYANPGFTNVQVRGKLQATAEDLGLLANEQGAGLVDAEKAAK